VLRTRSATDRRGTRTTSRSCSRPASVKSKDSVVRSSSTTSSTPYRSRGTICDSNISQGTAHFSELGLRHAFYALLQSDMSKMRLVPEAVFSENDFICGIPDVHILHRESLIKVYRGFSI
jgi:hypothetical protein